MRNSWDSMAIGEIRSFFITFKSFLPIWLEYEFMDWVHLSKIQNGLKQYISLQSIYLLYIYETGTIIFYNKTNINFELNFPCFPNISAHTQQKGIIWTPSLIFCFSYFQVSTVLNPVVIWDNGKWSMMLCVCVCCRDANKKWLLSDVLIINGENQSILWFCYYIIMKMNYFAFACQKKIAIDRPGKFNCLHNQFVSVYINCCLCVGVFVCNIAVTLSPLPFPEKKTCVSHWMLLMHHTRTIVVVFTTTGMLLSLTTTNSNQYFCNLLFCLPNQKQKTVMLEYDFSFLTRSPSVNTKKKNAKNKNLHPMWTQ